MTKKLSETIAEVNYDHLVYSNDENIITSGVVVAAGQGELKRGTALAKTADNKMVILGTKSEAGYIKVDSTTPGALKVVESSPSSGEIAVASVTPVVDDDYTPAANDYVLLQEAGLYDADCILCDDIDASTEDVETVAYIKGHFNADALILAEDYTLTENDKDTFRTKGILLSTIQG